MTIKLYQSPDDFNDARLPIVPIVLPTAQPLELKVDGFFLTVSKGGQPILRINTEDMRALFTTNSILTGIIKGNLVPQEIKDLNDNIESIIRGSELGS